MGEILTPDEVADWGVWWASGDAFGKAGRLIDSHEALRAALAAAEERAERTIRERDRWRNLYRAEFERAEAEVRTLREALTELSEAVEDLDTAQNGAQFDAANLRIASAQVKADVALGEKNDGT